MKNAISFLHEGVQHFSITGSKYLMESLGTNATTAVVLNSKVSYSGEMKKLNNGSTRFALELPMVNNAVVTKDGDYFLVEGTVLIDGAEVPVKLTKDELIFEMSTPEPEPEPVAEEKVEPAVEVKEVPAEKVEEAPVEKIEAEVTEEPVKEPEPIVEVPAEKAEVVVEPEPVAEKKVMPKPALRKDGKRAGFSFGKRQASVSTNAKLGAMDNTIGCMFGATLAAPTYPRSQRKNPLSGLRGTRSANTAQRQVQTVQVPRRSATYAEAPLVKQEEPVVRNKVVLNTPAPEPQQNKEPDMYDKIAEDLKLSWNAQPIGQREPELVVPKTATEVAQEFREKHRVSLDKPVRVPTPLVRDDHEPEQKKVSKIDRAEAKKAARAQFSAEVDKIIGDIPPEMLGNIEEFTTEPVNVSVLNTQGNLFCIDHRWHRNGKWFCIDVVPNAARYFYNADRGVSLEITLGDLKKWKEAIS